MLNKLHHIGILVEDFEAAIKKYEGFGLKCSTVVEKEAEGMKLAFFPLGETLIEFVSYSADKGLDHLNTVVRSQKGTINHLCFEVDDMEATVRDFTKNGAKLVEGTPKKGATGLIAFFYPETTENVLVELCET